MREYREVYNYELYKRRSRVTKRKLENRAGGLKGWGPRQSADDPRFRYASLISNRENPQAPISEIWT